MVTTPNYDLDVDTTLGGNNASDYIIPSQKAIKAYVDNNTGSTVDQTYDPTSQAAQSGVAIAGELTKYAQKAVDTDITGVYNFKGQKKIKFTQSSSSDKLGFTLYNNSNVEKGYLEYNPTNTVDSVPLMTLGNYASSTAGLTHVGFRKYSSVSGASGAYNLLAPLVSDAKTPFSLTTTYTNFYLPLGFTDGTTTVKTAKTGVVDLSSLGYIKGITSSDVTTALGYTPYNSSNPSGYQANVIETVKVNNTALTPSSKAVNITVPTKLSDLTDDTATYPIDKADTLTGLTATITELNYTDGVTSNIQTQLDNKAENDVTVFHKEVAARYYWYKQDSSVLWYGYTSTDTPSIGTSVKVYDSRDTSQTQIYNASVSSVSSNTITVSSIVSAINGLTFNRISQLDEAGYYELVDKNDNELDVRNTYLELSILDALYPVGSIYIGTMATCPLETLGIGTWTLKGSGQVLQGSDANNTAGSSISASLPQMTAVSNGDHSHNRGTMNISGGPITVGRFASSQSNTSGALKAASGTSRGTGYYGSTTSYDANLTLTASSNWSGATNTTGAHTHTVEWTDHVGTTVQPDAYVVNIWERTA